MRGQANYLLRGSPKKCVCGDRLVRTELPSVIEEGITTVSIVCPNAWMGTRHLSFWWQFKTKKKKGAK